jgi:hypothetical protein
MMTYKRNIILKVYVGIFILSLIYVLGSSFYAQMNSTYQVEIDTILNKTNKIRAEIKINNDKVEKLKKVKSKVLRYAIDKKKATLTVNKLKKAVNKSGGILIINNIDLKETKFINLLIFNISFGYDISTIDADIAKELMKDYINIVFKNKFSTIGIKFINDHVVSIKIKK